MSGPQGGEGKMPMVTDQPCRPMNFSAFLTMAIPAGVAMSGGVLAAVWKPPHQIRSLIQHFAAGVILAALAL